VLYYDHHCPWIGQCVGARNRKVRLKFLLANKYADFFHRYLSQSYRDFNYDHHHLFDRLYLRPENHVQFFVNFLIWCVALTTYVFATLLPIVVITGNRTVAGGDLIDGQVVGVIGT